MFGTEIKNDKQYYIMNNENSEKMLLSNVDDFIEKHPNILHVLSENIEETKKKLRGNDEKFINQYKQFKNTYDELFLLCQINEDEIDKYVFEKKLKTVKRIVHDYYTLVYTYSKNKKNKKFDKKRVKMHMVLVLYDKLNYTDFEKTKQLLELFYDDKLKELGIDLQLIRDIFNLEKDEKKKREEKVLKMYREGMFDEDMIEQYDQEDDS